MKAAEAAAAETARTGATDRLVVQMTGRLMTASQSAGHQKINSRMEALLRSHSALKVARRARTASQPVSLLANQVANQVGNRLASQPESQPESQHAQHPMMTQAAVHYRLPARSVKASQQVKAVAVRLNGANLKEERS